MNLARFAPAALARLLAALAILTLAGCAAPAADPGSTGASRSSVEVFGTIDASVSGVRNKSGR